METTEMMKATLEVSDFSLGFVLRSDKVHAYQHITWPASASYPL